MRSSSSLNAYESTAFEDYVESGPHHNNEMVRIDEQRAKTSKRMAKMPEKEIEAN